MIMIECQKMTQDLLPDAYSLLTNFLSQDEYYLDSSAAYGDSGNAALFDALKLFLEHPEHGFVWLAYDHEVAVGVCLVSLAISTSIGAMVARLDDFYVATGKHRRGIGTAMLDALREELNKSDVRRIDTSVHMLNDGGRRFYQKNGFLLLNEERLSRVL